MPQISERELLAMRAELKRIGGVLDESIARLNTLSSMASDANESGIAAGIKFVREDLEGIR